MSSELEKQSPSLVDENDWVRAVARLIRLTEGGKLKWKSAPAPRAPRSAEPEQQVDVVFTAEYEGKRLRLYIDAKNIEDELPILNVGPFRKKYPYWAREVVLELGDEAEHGWYTVPYTEATEDRLESVKYHVLGVDDFLDRVLETPGA
jgi:hypothetical protein